MHLLLSERTKPTFGSTNHLRAFPFPFNFLPYLHDSWRDQKLSPQASGRAEVPDPQVLAGSNPSRKKREELHNELRQYLWLKVTTDLLLLSLPNRDQRMHGARDIWYTMSAFKGKWEPTEVLLSQCLHMIQYRHVHIFKVSFGVGAATASLTWEGAVAPAASSCRVTRMDQDWKQAVRLWSWQRAALPCLPLETGQTRYLGKH